MGGAVSASRTDIIWLFDIDFIGTSLSSREIKELERSMVTNDPAEPLYRESFGWVYYGEALPGCRRFFFDSLKLKDISGVRCCTLLVRPENGAGVFSIWQRFGKEINPFEARQRDVYDQAIPHLRQLIGVEIKPPDRMFPFIAVTVDSDDLAKYTEDHAEELGKLFTGYFEEDEKGCLIESMRKNLSKRRYERLFLRWTDVLAVYSLSIEEDQQEKSMLRAVQLYETCILVSRLCKNLSHEANDVSSWLRFAPLRPWAADRVLSSFIRIEGQFVVAPPVQSVEAARLLSGAYRSFGIEDMIEGARNSCQFLENRWHWGKMQFLVALGVLTYLLDKLEVFKWVAKYILRTSD
jgi:hypothetical protein